MWQASSWQAKRTLQPPHYDGPPLIIIMKIMITIIMIMMIIMIIIIMISEYKC